MQRNVRGWRPQQEPYPGWQQPMPPVYPEYHVPMNYPPMGGYHPAGMEYMQSQHQMATNSAYGQSQGLSHTLFQDPLQEIDHFPNMKTRPQVPMHPYPQGMGMGKPPGQKSGLLNSFKSQSGSLDINKMVDTAGQFANAIAQVSHMAKGLGGLFK